ncbi:hypothetical protein ACH5RR_004900 [Cinchona calisaya]|uniref:Protein kinase domain-containing protein n=1 Tax=Cinchona calisaya TaxID=153742 RepID=A0ABD3AYZ2_9GENT
MEGLIPLVYRAIMQYKNGNQGMIGSWVDESVSAPYMRLPGDSGRFQMADIQLFRSDCAFSTTTTSPPSSSATKRMVSAGVQSPGCHLTPRRAVNESSSVLKCKIFQLELDSCTNVLEGAKEIRSPETSALKSSVASYFPTAIFRDSNILRYAGNGVSTLRELWADSVPYPLSTGPNCGDQDYTGQGSQTAYFVRVHEGGCLAYQSFVNLDPSLPVSNRPLPGTELMWESPKEPVCKSQVDCLQLPRSKCLGLDGTNGSTESRHGRSCKVRKKISNNWIFSSRGAILLLILSGILVHLKRCLSKRQAKKILVKEREEILNANSNGKSAKLFTGKEIKRATNNFSKDNLLGSGGLGEVFKGTLADGTIIAVKRAKPGNMKGIVQVLNEVRILCQDNHCSLVGLLGCCVELEQPLLIYEYIPNGTLFDHLHGFRLRNWVPLNWLRRHMIPYQNADGLSYLHSSANPPIYHRDVKSSNILLDEKLDAKVSDFGLSRLVESSESDYTHINTSAHGMLGDLDPEYYFNLQLTDKSDVYSFGVVLLELLTSEKTIDFNRDEENVNLVVYLKKILGEEQVMDVIDPTLKELASKVELATMQAIANLAGACLDDRRQNRPSMKDEADDSKT